MNSPTATGNLGATPLCELLVYALTEALSGSLVFECPNRSKHAVLLQAGRPLKARVDDVSVRLGEVLLALGHIDAATRRAVEAGPPGQLFGERLLARGAVDAQALEAALDEQLARQLAWIAAAPPGTAFAYYEGVNFLESWGRGQRDVDPLALVWRAIYGGPPRGRIQLACDGLAGKTLRLHPASRVGRFGFGSGARALLDVLRVKPQTLAELEATGLMEAASLHQLLYALVLTRHLDTGLQPLGVAAAAPAAPMPAGAPISKRHPGSSAALRRPPSAELQRPEPPQPPAAPASARETAQTGRFLTREEINAKLDALEGQSHYEILGVARGASSDEIAAAFTALARAWHPDRSNPEHADVRESVTRVFARMTEAYRVIGQQASRDEYERSLGAGSEDAEQAQVDKVLRSAESFQKAEILLKKRDLRGAERLAELAHLGDPSQPEYGALYAWIRARRPDASKETLAEALTVLKAAAKTQSENVKIRYYLASVLKLDGQDAAALREFRFVADRDPGNLEAARELRLHEMRRKHDRREARESSGGIFERLFKR